MPHTLFISDLHLSTARPGINALFSSFMGNIAPQAEALYILGDLFEYWVGDDDRDAPFNATIVSALARLTRAGTALYLMHGNRDFLLGPAFAEACGGKILPDPYLTDFYGTATLLMHGDLLCTDDVRYQAFRRQVRQPAWQAEFLRRPIPERHALVEGVSRINEQEKNLKTEAIMDVAPGAVGDALRAHGYPRLIHGHTHRPARHMHSVDNRDCERWVLTDWYEHGGYLRCDSAGCTAILL